MNTLRRTLPALLMLAGALINLRGAVAADRPPNVVMIVSDDQAWSDYGFMGHETIKTPSLDKLASQSAVFTRGYVPSSLCRPSLMTMLTGLYPHQHGICGNDPARGTVDRSAMVDLSRQATMLPELLGEHGYISLQTGKWWEGHPRVGGFTHYMSHGDPKNRGRHGDLGLKIGREGMQPVFDFIDSAGEKPFFVWYAPFMPHSPHTPPERLLTKYLAEGRSQFVAKYYAMCEWFDETCGQLLDHLDEHGLAENTLVVYVTDNGWIQQEQGRRFAPRSKTSPYEGGVRTPIMLRWPGHVQPGRHDELASSLDLAPTILRACGLEPTSQMVGLDLVALADGAAKPREVLFGEIFSHDVPEVGNPAAGLQHRWCIEGRWKLILPQSADEEPELYDVLADPWEEQDLAAENKDVVDRLTGHIKAWWPLAEEQTATN